MEVVYCAYSDTIRQMPQNYLLAHRVHRAWVNDPDLAADKGLVVKMALALMEFECKYGTPERVLEELNKEES